MCLALSPTYLSSNGSAAHFKQLRKVERPLEQEASVGFDEEEIIANIAEMRYAALALGRVAHGGRDIDTRQAGPSESNGKHRVEVKSPSGPAAGEYS